MGILFTPAPWIFVGMCYQARDGRKADGVFATRRRPPLTDAKIAARATVWADMERRF
jgi:hypothetical protein